MEGAINRKPGEPDDLRKRAEKAVLMTDTIETLSPEEVRQMLHELQVHQVELEMQNEELRRAQADLEASRERYFDLYDMAPVGYFTLSERGLILEANLRAAQLLNMERNALAKLPFSRFILPEDQDIYYQHHRRLVAMGGPEECELRLARDGNSRLWVRLTATAAKDSDGNPVYRVVADNITERKLVEEALKESEKKYKDLVHMVPDVIFECDMEGRLTLLNQAGYEVFGYSPEHFDRGMNVFEVLVPEDRERARENMGRTLSPEGRRSKNDYKALREDGSIIAITIHSSPVMQNGKPVGVRGVLSDITDRKRAEEDLARDQKLESLGVLAGGIAHDFNNLMTVILGNVELAMMDLPVHHRSYPLLNTVLESTEQTKDLTGRLLTFSRDSLVVKQERDVSKILRNAVQKILRVTPVRVTFDIETDGASAEVDETQIRQTFYNLTMNAVEAMPEGGTLTIGLHSIEVQSSDGLPLKEGRYLKITFADTGTGIAEDHLSRVFDPYFTTKDMGDRRGMGLGLSVCYSVLKKHGGHIAVASQPGKGATFTIYLPAMAAKAPKIEAQQRATPLRKRVLIMEDEVQVRALERAFLERLGYEVTEAGDGREAIDRYKESLLSNNPFDLVILDLMVRHGLGGQPTMERLMKEDPSVRAIIATGHNDDPVIKHYREYGFQGALNKPFRFSEFEQTVKAVIDAGT